jgi:UDP-galactopyranose mutase
MQRPAAVTGRASAFFEAAPAKLVRHVPCSTDQSRIQRPASGEPLMEHEIVCFSHLRWHFVWQRPQHLMTRAARTRRVWFVEEPIECAGDARLELETVSDTLTLVRPTVRPGMNRPERLRAQGQLLTGLFQEHISATPVHWYYTPMAREFSRGLPAGPIVYDCMDELSAFAGAPAAMLLWELELLAIADLVFTGGTSLYEAKRLRHPSVHKFPSSVDAHHFNAARDPLPDPEEQAHLPRPRIGFAGVIDERLDRTLLAQVAESRPGYTFVLVGPTAKIDPAALPQAPNIHYLGQKPYEQLPAFLANWDVAMMPFAKNEATKYISPTKTPEYLAAGRRVVSTSITDVVTPYGELDLVSIADTPEEFAAAIDAALQPADPGWQRDVDRFLAGSSWDRTWHQMQRILSKVPARHRPIPMPQIGALDIPTASAPAVQDDEHHV